MNFSGPADSPAKITESRIRLLTWAVCAYAVGTLVSMAAMSVAFGVLAAVFLFACGGPRGALRQIGLTLQEPLVRRLMLFSVLLGVACSLSLIVSEVSPLSYSGTAVEVSFFRDARKLWYLFLPLLLVPSLNLIGPDGQRAALRSWLAAFFVFALIGIQQYFTGWPRPQPIPGNEPYFHATLGLGHHLSVASVFLFPFFASVDAWRSDAPGRRKVLLGIVTLAGGLLLFFTWSRMLWVALPVSMGAWAILALSGRRALIALIVLSIGGSFAVSRPEVRERLVSTMGVGDRQELWRANLDFLRERPLTGTGFQKNHPLAYPYLKEKYPGRQSFFIGHAHNNFIEMLGGTGVLGAIAWLIWSAFILALAWKLARHGGSFWGPGIFAAWLAFHVNGLTQVNFWEGKVLHQVMWVVSWMLVLAEGSVPRLFTRSRP